MNSILQTQMDAYALMKARQGIAREGWVEIHNYQHWVKLDGRESWNAEFCRDGLRKLIELGRSQFPTPRPTIPPEVKPWTEEERRDAYLYSNFGRY